MTSEGRGRKYIYKYMFHLNATALPYVIDIPFKENCTCLYWSSKLTWKKLNFTSCISIRCSSLVTASIDSTQFVWAAFQIAARLW